ncbi:peptide chain release factor N(5)-glutamine methyltransferase [Oleiharenicola lentus]|uniref:Release factor glutamine methyltransferase n=1 Tax=Oleiharenicola lentus TaxID=2508720 RepID=A0A4Q1C3J2_9BACT|nr:peptide chain release factor N(5)-glutamine methyltransferase [Oleiharenicola lentus]RXK52833.1 peptide chain release factor N(5)-glutamine methyltransferase [Oleiharenicola lentus]
MLSVLEIIKRTTEFFDKRGVESARLNAELLIGHALGLKRMQLYLQFERPLTEAELELIRPLVKRRGAREPLQYILGATEFCGLKLKVDRRALIPRPETEYLVELVGEKLTTAPKAVLDLGTGTGALALALAVKYPASCVTAVDNSAEALTLAGENTQALGLAARVRLLASDWFSALVAAEKFDLIVANPPYLTDAEVAEATPEVREHEPRAALVAAEEGRADLERIFHQARGFLNAGGLLACETGIAQHARLAAVARECGYARTESLRDLTGRDRYLLAFV